MAESKGLMTSEDFQKFFQKILLDEKFREELEHDFFCTLETHGLKIKISEKLRGSIIRIVAQSSREGRCGGCHICSLCVTEAPIFPRQFILSSLSTIFYILK